MRLRKKLKVLEGGPASSYAFKSIKGMSTNQDYQNRTEHSFLPQSLKSKSERSKMGYQASLKSNAKSSVDNFGGFPSVKGATSTHDEYGYDVNKDPSERTVSQMSVSQKRGEQVLAKNRKQMDELKKINPMMGKALPVASIEPLKDDDATLNVKLSEGPQPFEDDSFNVKPPEFADEDAVQANVGDDLEGDSNFEEGGPDDYNLNEI